MIARAAEREPRAPGPGSEELGQRYAAYRRRHATRLLHLLPRDAVRPLYRRALEAASEPAAEDPLEALVGLCETLLPLPPFEVWAEDLRAHPEAHLRDLEETAEPPTSDAPSTLDVRSFDFDGSVWWARLRSFRDGSMWRGYIVFESPETGGVHRTALIFSEHDPTDVRARFLEFEIETLHAFLRSTLP